MSFSTEVSAELAALQIKKPCCRRALVLGMLMGARKSEENKYISYFYEKSSAELVFDSLKKIFHADAGLDEMVRAGRKTYALSFKSSGVADFLYEVEKDSDMAVHAIAGFKCGGCQNAFLRGVFMGCGSITDPKRSYHMEFVFPCEGRANIVDKMLTAIIGKPNRIKRGERYSVYYKNNNAILDFLYGVGCSHSGIYMANSFIERDIRNNENRATNCVARNISRSVGAAQKHVSAIESLIESKRFDRLPKELRYTARLRLENDSASLYELALMHEPSITKSGLNRRLARIMEIARENEK
ncbi:MAG: DNA-binding protein WhiA [Ruminococcaceae bacterium]|nr:DNA-binding protein WhiA [Oscillospiraceae bacterium]